MMRIGFTGYSAGGRACLASHGSASKTAAHATARHAIGIREALRGAMVIRRAMKAVTECPIVILKLSRGSTRATCHAAVPQSRERDFYLQPAANRRLATEFSWFDYKR